MCGFTGFWQPRAEDEGALTERVRAMAAALYRRGPDDSGTWVDGENGVALGFRRLAILDLSDAGHQPMTSVSGRYIVVFNGEIYNFLDLRGELETKGHVFRGHSDTEVLLASIEEWGLEPALKRFNGMFAFAVWDRANRELLLARDRIGIKPLYFGWNRGCFYFGSELKSFHSHREFVPRVDRTALTQFLKLGYVPAPLSIYVGIAKLGPGESLTIRGPQEPVAAPRPYWSMRDAVCDGVDRCYTDPEQALHDIDDLLNQSVRRQMVADVPLGAFLSGGIDSSLVTALMQKHSTRAVKTFSVGFTERAFDEAPFARDVARHLGTDHTEFYVTPDDAMGVIPTLPEVYDEPFADSSQIPTCLVSAMAKRHVKVALSGDGADEIFGGYGQYWLADHLWRWVEGIAPPLRPVVAQAMKIAAAPLSQVLPGRLRGVANEWLSFRGAILKARSDREYYGIMRMIWRNADRIVKGGDDPGTAFTQPETWLSFLSFPEHMMYMDSVVSLPDDMLVKVDRASMAASLEVRVPLLDHRLVEAAWRLPMSMKMSGATGKQVLRTILYRHVPRELIDRPKQGFGVPVAAWLRGPLRDWAENLIDPQRLSEQGYFSTAAIRQEWHNLLSGERQWEARMWHVLMFQAWLERWTEKAYAG